MLLKEGGYYVLKFFDRYDFALITCCDCIIPMNFWPCCSTFLCFIGKFRLERNFKFVTQQIMEL